MDQTKGDREKQYADVIVAAVMVGTIMDAEDPPKKRGSYEKATT